MHPSVGQCPKILHEPRNILDSSTSKKLFISWNKKYKQVTFLTNHTSTNMVLNHTLLNTYSLENNILNKFLKDGFFDSISSAYVIPWQFKNYKKKCESKKIIIQEGDVVTELSSHSIYIQERITAEHIQNSKISSSSNEWNYNAKYEDSNCRYFFTENYLFIAYLCKDIFITNSLEIGAFELHETVLNNMKNYFKKGKKEEKAINYQIFVYEWDPKKNFEFKIDNEEFTITYNDDNSITINDTNSKENIQPISKKEKRNFDNLKQENKKPKASIWGLKRVVYSLLGLSLIILIIKKGYAFFNFK